MKCLNDTEFTAKDFDYCVFWKESSSDISLQVELYKVRKGIVAKEELICYRKDSKRGHVQWAEESQYWPKVNSITYYDQISSARCFSGECFKSKNIPQYTILSNKFLNQITRFDQLEEIDEEYLRRLNDTLQK